MARIRMSHTWFNKIRRKFPRPSHRNIILLNSSACSSPPSEAKASEIIEETVNYEGMNFEIALPSRKELTKHDVAAIKIQAIFRGHLARRALRALRSLVKLQALIRGARARKQSQLALQCMHVLVRLRVRVRARQLVSQHSDV